MHAVFVDYTKAFDTINRSKLMENLENVIGEENPIARTTKIIMADNQVQIDYNITTSEEITQGRGCSKETQ